MSERKTLRQALRETKVQMITQALAETDGNVREAAKLLDVNRTHLHKAMTDLGIKTKLQQRREDAALGEQNG